MATYKVNEPYQVNRDGKILVAGDTFEPDKGEDVSALVTSGIVREVEEPKKRARKRSK